MTYSLGVYIGGGVVEGERGGRRGGGDGYLESDVC